MADQHPITPSPDLVSKWASEFYGTTIAPGEAAVHIAHQAAQWGADQELEACCDWLKKNTYHITIEFLRNARRPKPPSRKEQALEAIGRLCASVIHDDLKNDAANIRRALEQLPDAHYSP